MCNVAHPVFTRSAWFSHHGRQSSRHRHQEGITQLLEDFEGQQKETEVQLHAYEKEWWQQEGQADSQAEESGHTELVSHNEESGNTELVSLN